MSDDIRKVMRTTPWSPLKSVGRADGRKEGGARHSDEGGDAEDEAAPEEAFSVEEMEELHSQVEAANERLRAAGRRIEIDIIDDSAGPLIEMSLPGEAGGEHVSRRVRPKEFPEWVSRLESGEGLIIDERL